MRIWLWKVRVWLADVRWRLRCKLAEAIAPKELRLVHAADTDQGYDKLCDLWSYTQHSGHLCNRTKSHRRIDRELTDVVTELGMGLSGFTAPVPKFPEAQ